MVLVYAKSPLFENGLLPRSDESRARYINPDHDPRGPWKPVDYWNIASVEDRPNLVYPITNPNTGTIINPQHKAWKYAREVHDAHVRENRIWWGKNGDNEVPALKLFLSEALTIGGPMKMPAIPTQLKNILMICLKAARLSTHQNQLP